VDRLTSLPRSDLYVVYSISNSPYQQWQADLLDFSIREVAQKGVVIRLCSLDVDHPTLEVRPSAWGHTFVTPSFAELGSSWFQIFLRWVKRRLEKRVFGRYHFYCLNKPYAMKSFLKAHPALDDDSRLLWLDPDMVFNRPWEPSTVEVRKGLVCGQRWWGYDRRWCLSGAGSHHGASVPAGDSAVMFPFCISVADMRRISDPFCRLSREVYHRTRDWKSEMYALVLAMSSAGLKCSTMAALGTCNNWPDGLPDEVNAPISHYTQPMTDSSGAVFWNKRSYTPHTLSRPWDRPPRPDRALTLTDRRTLEMVHRFIDWQEVQVNANPCTSSHERAPESA
jgi:hypothetical protein